MLVLFFETRQDGSEQFLYNQIAYYHVLNYIQGRFNSKSRSVFLSKLLLYSTNITYILFEFVHNLLKHETNEEESSTGLVNLLISNILVSIATDC